MQILTNSIESLEEDAAEIIKDKIYETLAKKEFAILAICGGENVKGIFQKLTKADIPWQDVHIFLTDEILAPLDSPDSNYKIAHDFLIKEIVGDGKISEENVHPFYYDKPLKQYENELIELGGGFDIVLLSAGEDGHIAGLFPKLTIKNEEDYFIAFNNSPKPPKERMTATRKLIETAQAGILLFFGEEKRQAFDKLLDDNIILANCPVKIIRLIPDSFVLTNLDISEEFLKEIEKV